MSELKEMTREEWELLNNRINADNPDKESNDEWDHFYIDWKWRSNH
jgi:hypothetical protein